MARKSYRDFLATWKDADPDIPVLIHAKQDSVKLTSGREPGPSSPFLL